MVFNKLPSSFRFSFVAFLELMFIYFLCNFFHFLSFFTLSIQLRIFISLRSFVTVPIHILICLSCLHLMSCQVHGFLINFLHIFVLFRDFS